MPVTIVLVGGSKSEKTRMIGLAAAVVGGGAAVLVVGGAPVVAGGAEVFGGAEEVAGAGVELEQAVKIPTPTINITKQILPRNTSALFPFLWFTFPLLSDNHNLRKYRDYLN
jgi:hypothetical protein